jgi:hypothetical protein
MAKEAEKSNGMGIGEFEGVRAMAAPTYLVEYVDGNGKKETRLAFIVGDQIRFLSDGGLTKPAQTWLKNKILVAAGLRDPDSIRTESNVAHTPTEEQI